MEFNRDDVEQKFRIVPARLRDGDFVPHGFA